MKTIGLLGGTGWPSTIGYYKLLNQLVHKRLGGYHSAKILLKSIDYHEIKSNYHKNPEKVADILHEELLDFMSPSIHCLIICCNSLHKYYDIIKYHLYPDPDIPVFHAVELVAQNIKKQDFDTVLLLATKATMEDGFFTKILQDYGIKVVIPDQQERDEMQKIHSQELTNNVVTEQSKAYFANIIQQHPECQAVVLGCTEYPLLINPENSALPIIDPVQLQCEAAVNFALQNYKIKNI